MQRTFSRVARPIVRFHDAFTIGESTAREDCDARAQIPVLARNLTDAFTIRVVVRTFNVRRACTRTPYVHGLI